VVGGRGCDDLDDPSLALRMTVSSRPSDPVFIKSVSEESMNMDAVLRAATMFFLTLR
jgi:hypothetical protein